jgi:hypothetical protein
MFARAAAVRSGAQPINVDFANGFIGELSSELQS